MMHGLGRCEDDAGACIRIIERLLEEPRTSHNIACMAFMLSRRAELPSALSVDLVTRLQAYCEEVLTKEHGERNYQINFVYATQLIGGMLRYREKEPYALVSSTDSGARRLSDLLGDVSGELRRLGRRVRRVEEKTVIAVELKKHLDGSGGDPNLLIRIDELAK